VGTLRFRITALATALVAAILVVAAFALVAAQRQQLTESVDDRLDQQVETLAELVEQGRLPAEPVGFDDDTTVRVVSTTTGEVIAATDEDADDDEATRSLTRRADGPDGPVEIQVVASLEDVEESTSALGGSLVVVIPAVVVLLAALVWWLVGRALRPVEAIRSEVARIGGRDLDRRVPVTRRDDEIARLARTMNTMLDRIEEANARQERFVADAAHELRSPLTRMRSELEVDDAAPEAADPAATRRSVLDETIALQRLVDDLLQLARSGGEAGALVAVPVDLDDLVLRQVRRVRADSRVAVDVSRVSAAQVVGDPDQLGRAVRNLADNAVRHAAAEVTFTLVEADGVARLTIADDGPGIPPSARERVFDRFARLDDARVRDDGGTGLGLAITRDIVEAHGGTVVVDDGPGPGARFVVTIPLPDT
jgi:signal transduction histidine kinase